MKKLISLLLALAMVMSLSVTAFAAEGDVSNAETGAYSTDVTGSYVAGTTASGTVFSVDITWTAMSFTYHAEKAPVWDATNHEYSESTPAKWEGKGTITVTNHSNAKISATPEYTPGENYVDANMVFDTEQLDVASAESGSAQVGTITVTPTGSLPQMDTAATIGSITVTIAQDTRITAVEVDALLTNAKARLDAWTAAGYGEDGQYLVNYLNEISVAISAGTITQSVLDSEYASCLAKYNELEAAVNG